MEKSRRFEYTFITLIYSEDFIDDFIHKMKFSKGFNVQWIIFDKSGQKNTNIFKKLKRYNIIYRSACLTWSDAKCYNLAMGLAEGKYICFTNQYISYDKNTLKSVPFATSKYPDQFLICISYKFEEEKKKRIHMSLDLQNIHGSNNIHTFLHSFFIKNSFARNIKFTDVCEEETGTMYILSAYEKTDTLVYIKNIYCGYPEKLRRKSNMYYGSNNKDFYIESLKYNYLPLMMKYDNSDTGIPRWLQYAVYYQVYFKFYSNMNVRDKALLNQKEREEFFSITKRILNYIDDEIIMSNMIKQQFSPPFSIRNLFAHLKYDGDMIKLNPFFTIENNKLYFYQLGCKYDLSKHQDLKVMAVNIKNGRLIMDMRFFTSMINSDISKPIYAEVNGVRYDCKERGEYSFDKVFGVSIKKSYVFQLKVNLEDFALDNIEIKFFMELGGKRIAIPLNFFRAPSKLNGKCKHSYWRFKSDSIMYYSNNSIYISRISLKELEKREKLYRKECIKWVRETTKDRKKRIKYVKEIENLRNAYFQEVGKKRRIWIYFDKLFKGGDNGEYQFRHDFAINDGVERYYIINEDSNDAKRLKEQFGDHILFFGTMKCKLYGLLAENIVATHPDIIEFVGFDKKETFIFKDLFNPNLICIAHGVTIQKNAEYQNRIFDNTMFYTTSSKYEVKHILHPIYGYDKEDVALTGMARFDGLKNNDKKQILITPTWRRNIVGKAQRNSTRQKSHSFRDTNYFKIYNRLINDKRLINAAKREGYRLIFLIHPSMSAQIDDYDKNEYVELIAASGDMNYEKILTESSLMVTDYSGIHYDFGYMRKPVIYYQPKEIPMRFEEGGMKFDSMGFGPVCIEYEQAVKLICEYIYKGCKMPDVYKKRADDFFAYNDHNNCDRIYEAIAEWTNKKRLKS